MKYLVPTLTLLLILISCLKEPISVQEEIDISELSIDEIQVPEGFDFATKQTIELNITDAESKAIYQVYAWSEETEYYEIQTYTDEGGNSVTDSVFVTDVLNQILLKISPCEGIVKQYITIPVYYTHLYLRRKVNGVFSSHIIDISKNKASYTHTTVKSAAAVEDILFCVNGAGQLFSVNPETGNLTEISDMPMGSWTCAIDNTNRELYTIGRTKPYPLNKYSIDSDKWTSIADLGFGGPRLDYNSKDGFLYFSNIDYVKKIDPDNGNVISSKDIKGLSNTSGGDLAFRDDGELYMCTFGGLFHLAPVDDYYQASRISGDNLPFNPTSMTFDKNNELWLSNNATKSDLIIMDTQTGGYEYRYGINSSEGANSEINRTINDLTTLYNNVADPEKTDSDGDGILNSDDEYPYDAEKAFELFTPSKYGWGTHAFEDLWPEKGDYDFNDIILNYKIVLVINSKNKIAQVNFFIKVKDNGASHRNGYGIEFKNLPASRVESVVGQLYSHNHIILAANGVEAGQEEAVVIIFDNTQKALNKELQVEVKFTSPVTIDELGADPFNPFMISDLLSGRDREIHLPYQNPTSLGKRYSSINSGATGSERYYVTPNGMPWAIDIVHDFKAPKEKIPVNLAYNYFTSWAASGGTEFSDWYKDNPGYRNTSKLQ